MLKKLKCDQCGSVDFIQQENDLYVCKFCGAKIQQPNPTKDKILKDLKSPKKFHHSIKFIKAKFSEDEFYKKAISNLSMNKYAPNDILESTFARVDYTYKFFAVIDADFTAMQVENIVNEKTENSVYFSSESTIHYSEDKRLAIKASDNMTDEEFKFVTKDLSVWSEESNVTELSEDEIKNISLPSGSKIEELVNKTIETAKKKILANEVEDDCNTILHKIKSVTVYAIPKYSLEYTYENKKYEIGSFANSLNLTGKIPTSKEKTDTPKSKTMTVFNVVSSILSVMGVILSIVILNVKQYVLNLFAAIMVAVFIIMFFVNTMAEFVAYKNVKKKNFEKRKLRTTEFMKKSGYELSDKDINYIDNLKG